MYILYSICLFIALVFYIPFYFVKLKIIRGTGLNLKERLGFKIPRGLNRKNSIWLHAVSVGEVLSLQNLVKLIKAHHPDWVIYFSSLTATGLQIAREKLGDVDEIFCVPVDFRSIVRKFFKALQPRLFILTESEFWPNLILEAKQQTKAVLLINGRISEKTSKRFSHLKRLVRKVLKNIDLFLVQTESDRHRLLKAGVNAARIKVAGNLKAELSLPDYPPEKVIELKNALALAIPKKVVVAGSTHKGEEEQLLSALVEAKKQRLDIALVIAPRHLQRVAEISALAKNFNIEVALRTKVKVGKKWDVLILDTIGELAQFYALADVAFVGGSLVKWGGQNFLEPAFYGKPIFFGPYMHNFAYLSKIFIEAKAAQLIRNREELLAMFFFMDEENLKSMGVMARKTLMSLQGATTFTFEVIEDLMK